jgi:hypothetical protein
MTWSTLPLNEASEAYDIDVLDGGALVVRKVAKYS